MRVERGSITAEWALTIPAVLVALSVIVVSSQLLVQQRRLDSLTADAVRLMGLGISPAEAQHRVMTQSHTELSFQVDVDELTSVVCVTTREPAIARWPISGEVLTSTHCGLYVPSSQ